MDFGSVVRGRGLGGNLVASLRSLGGGEIHEYTSLREDARRRRVDRADALPIGPRDAHLARFHERRAAVRRQRLTMTAVTLRLRHGANRRPGFEDSYRTDDVDLDLPKRGLEHLPDRRRAVLEVVEPTLAIEHT